MWKRFDTQSKRNNTMKSDQISPPKKQNLRDSKSIVFIVVWASVATILLIIKTFSQSQVIGRDSTPLQYEAKKNWHGGSPTDLYKGSCYCGGDEYCMCTPSLAIDAIIEVHSSRLDTSTDALEREKDWPMSRKSCLAIRGHIPSEENDLNGRDTAHSAPNVRAAKIATLKDYSSAGKKRVLLPQDISIRNHVNEPSNTVRNRIHQESSYRLRHRGVQNSASSRTPAALNISQERVFSREQTSKRSGISIVLVFRRDPPSGFAIPGGFVEVGESVEHATAREVKEETNLDLLSVELFRIYSDPHRDARRHTASAVFRCIAQDASQLKRGDDAKDVRLVPLEDVLQLPLAFDHKKILSDYIALYHSSSVPHSP